MTRPQQERTKAELIRGLGMAFRQDQNRSQAFDELAAERLGINLTDLRCIDTIEQREREPEGPPTGKAEGPPGGVTAGELAEAAHLTSGAMTAVLDRLERAGYARRVPDPVDRRRVRVELTARARELTGEIYGPRGLAFHRVLDRYTAEELRLVLDLMHRSAAVGESELERLKGEG